MSTGASGLTPQQALLVLNALPHIGPITLNRLLVEFGDDPAAVLGAPIPQLERVKGVGPAISSSLARWSTLFDLAREEQRLAQAGADFVTVRDPSYPPLLREIHDPPIGLYRLGGDNLQGPCVALVGSRRTTVYGQTVARTLAAGLVRAGVCVVSGLARGIDTAAHEGALEAGGRTVAVLGNGIDIVYPPENLVLYRRIAERGAVLSEFPFTRRADRQSFAMRNRVVAGMCAATVVVESDVDGGALITAKFAGEQGRVVCAVPGRVDQATSAGCHRLIRDGAVLVTSVEDVLEEINYLGGLAPRGPLGPVTSGMDAAGPAPAAGGAAAGRGGAALTAEEAALVACFAGGEILTADALAGRLAQPVAGIAATLMMLELKRCVVKRADGAYEAR